MGAEKKEFPLEWEVQHLKERQKVLEVKFKEHDCELKKQHDADMENNNKVEDLHKILYRNGFRATIQEIKDDVAQLRSKYSKLDRKINLIIIMMCLMFGDKIWVYIGKIV